MNDLNNTCQQVKEGKKKEAVDSCVRIIEEVGNIFMVAQQPTHTSEEDSIKQVNIQTLNQ